MVIVPSLFRYQLPSAHQAEIWALINNNSYQFLKTTGNPVVLENMVQVKIHLSSVNWKVLNSLSTSIEKSIANHATILLKVSFKMGRWKILTTYVRKGHYDFDQSELLQTDFSSCILSLHSEFHINIRIQQSLEAKNLPLIIQKKEIEDICFRHS